MIFSIRRILYLTFQDIAPQAKLDKHRGPPLGVVAGFVFGILDKKLTG
ncbi:hypothetical protein AB2B38_000700 [Balneola sp. MJW-20]